MSILTSYSSAVDRPRPKSYYVYQTLPRLNIAPRVQPKNCSFGELKLTITLHLRWFSASILCCGLWGCDDNLPNTDHLKAPLIEAPAEAFRRPAVQEDPWANWTIVRRSPGATPAMETNGETTGDAPASPTVLGPVTAPTDAHTPLRGSLQPAPEQPMKLVLRSLADGTAIPLGLDTTQQPATAALIGEQGEFEVFVPRSEPGLIEIAIEAVATSGNPLSYAAVLEVPAAGPITLNDETALLGRLWRACAQSTLTALAQAPNESDWPVWDLLDPNAFARLTRAQNELAAALGAPSLDAEPVALQRAADTLLSRWQPSRALVTPEALGPSRTLARQADSLAGASWLETVRRIQGLLEARAAEVLQREPEFSRDRAWLLGTAQTQPPTSGRELAHYALEQLAFGMVPDAEGLLLRCLDDLQPPTDPETGVSVAVSLQVLRSAAHLSLAQLIANEPEAWRMVLARLSAAPRR